MTSTEPPRARVIDVHAHAVFDSALGTAGRFGPEIGRSPDGHGYYRIGEYRTAHDYTGTVFRDLDRRLAEMDRTGIDLQLLSPNPLTFFHGVPAREATDFCRATNDAMAEAVAAHPDRFAGTAALPMQDPAAAVTELWRAVTQLGLRGAYVGTDFGDPCAPEFDELMGTVDQLGVPLFFHPSSTDGEHLVADARLRERDLGLIVGYPYEESLTIARLVFGGLLDRYPALDVVLSHGGGSVPYLYGRMATAVKVRKWVPEQVRENGLLHYLRQFWYDVHLSDDAARDFLAARVGTSRLLFGTNFGGWDSAAGHDEGELGPVLTENAERLLGLKAGAE